MQKVQSISINLHAHVRLYYGKASNILLLFEFIWYVTKKIMMQLNIGALPFEPVLMNENNNNNKIIE